MTSKEDDAEDGPTVLYLTTNDISDPVRGCDRRSNQLHHWISTWVETIAISYEKSGEQRHRDTGSGHRRFGYPRIGILAPFDPRIYWHLLRQRAKGQRVDVIIASGMGCLLYAMLARFLFGARLVVDCHNVESQLSQDLDDFGHYVFAQTVERLALQLADLVLVTSKRDRSQFGEPIREKSLVVANGYDQSVFYPEDSEPAARILFFGNMRYPPNEEAVEEIANRIGPTIAEANWTGEIHIAGPHCDRIRPVVTDVPGVTVVGLVDGIADYIRGSAVVIVPLRTGSGTRLKIIESLACGTPVVSTPKGAEGWPRNWDSLVVTELNAFPERVLETLASGISPSPTELTAFHEYTWEQQVSRLKPYLWRLCEDQPPMTDA